MMCIWTKLRWYCCWQILALICTVEEEHTICRKVRVLFLYTCWTQITYLVIVCLIIYFVQIRFTLWMRQLNSDQLASKPWVLPKSEGTDDLRQHGYTNIIWKISSNLWVSILYILYENDYIVTIWVLWNGYAIVKWKHILAVSWYFKPS